MALITFIVGITMHWNRFKQFGHLKLPIWINIVNLAFFPWISALNSAQIGPNGGSGHLRLLDIALIMFIIRNTMDWNRFKEFWH